MRSGEYPLTRLAAAVVEYFLADEVLTRESLTLLTGTLRAQFAEVLAAAKKAGGENVWQRKVVGPLRVTVGRRGEWPDDLDLREAPELVRELARRGLWLEQEPLVIDARIAAALEAML